jgi:hypothetical protein
MGAMRHCILPALLIAGAADAKTRLDCTELDPGRALGAFKVGAKTDAAIQPDPLPGWFIAKEGAVRLRMDPDGTVAEIVAPLLPCAIAKGRIVESRDPRALAATLGTCGPVAVTEGGNTIACDGVTIVSGAQGGRQAPTVRVAKTPGPPVACGSYVGLGFWAEPTGAHETKKAIVLDVAAKGPVCVDGRDAPVSVKTRPADVLREGCREEKRAGGVDLVCPDATFSFTGAALSTVTVGG